MNLANHLWQSTVFGGAAALLTLALRQNRARLRHAVWLAASYKFLVPLSALLALGGQVHWRTALPAATSVLPAAIEQAAEPFTATAPFSPGPASQRSGSAMPAILWAVWATGCLGFAVAWWRRWRRVRAAVRAANRLPFDLPIPALSSAALLEPGVFGIFRPVLLLPEGIAGRLTPAQLEAVIAHELCHVRSRDNLAAAIHMFVETVFWFHPLTWWIGRRMVAERERACDEEVLRRGSEPRAYAEGILNVCKLYAESPLACVSGVSGSDLKRRIETILHHRVARRLSAAQKTLLASAGAAALAVPVAIGMLHGPAARAQTANAPKFEVASVKQVKDCGAPMAADMGKKGEKGVKKGGVRALSPGRLHVCTDLGELIRDAYVIFGPDRAHPPRDIEGGPAWVHSDLFDINAKADTPADQQTMMGPMLQAVLEDRFRVKVRRETREIPVYDLTVAKDGPKLHATQEGSCTPRDPSKPSSPPKEGEKPVCGMSGLSQARSGVGQWNLSGAEISQFASILGGLLLDRPVVDRTGIKGQYDIHLEFGFENLGPKFRHPPVDPDAPVGPSIFSAIQKLGLKLEPGKGPAEFLIIEQAERPTGN